MSDVKITKKDIKEFVEAAHGDLDKVRRLLAAKPGLRDLPNGRETALGAACQMKRPDIIAFLLEQGAPLDIWAACVLGDTARVAAFLDADPSLASAKNPASHGKTPLALAAGHPEVTALLQSRGAT